MLATLYWVLVMCKLGSRGITLQEWYMMAALNDVERGAQRMVRDAQHQNILQKYSVLWCVLVLR